MIDEIVNIILHVVLSSIFIAVFYFTYTTTVEEQVLTTNIEGLTENLIKDLTAFVPASALKPYIDSITLPDMTKDDQKAADSNNQLINISIIILSVFFGVGILSALALSLLTPLPVWVYFLNAFTILGFVALTEFIFLNTITRNYQVIDPSKVKGMFLTALLQFQESP